jgi:hypothetical protein
MILDGIKPAMVVGNQQALVGNEFTRTKTTKGNDGVFQAALINIIYITGTDLHAQAFHLFFVELSQQLGQPHAFVGLCHPENKKENEQQQVFTEFHIACFEE